MCTVLYALAYFVFIAWHRTEVCDTSNNHPHIVLMRDLDEDNEDVCGQFFVAVEQSVMLECSNIFATIFYLIAAHYMFNIEYHAKVNYPLLFLQENVLGLPSKSIKHTPTALSHFTSIPRYLEHTPSEMEEGTDRAEEAECM